MSFVNPSAWAFASLFAVLIALYLWEHTRRRVDVPSLLLWQAVPERLVRARRFRPNWLFVLQCLVLGLLISGLADPYFSDPSGGAATTRSIFVIDRSASMQAREGRTTRFELARSAIRDRLASLGAADEAMLIGAAHHPQVVAPFSPDHSELLRRLAALEPLDVRANLDAALAVAQRAVAGGEHTAHIELFTDMPREQLAAAWRSGIGILQLGETDDNLAVESVQVHQGRFQDHRDARAYVAVRNFAHREAHGVLTLQLDDAVFGRLGFSLQPRSASGFPLHDLPGPGVLRASLEVDDALAADNHAVAYVQPARPLHVRLVSADAGLREQLGRLARATPLLAVEFIDPAQSVAAAGADVVIYHRIAPPLPSEAASLYVFPAPGDGSPFAVRGTASEVPLHDWNARHPSLHGLRPELPFPLTAVADVAVPSWADPLLTGRIAGHDVALAFAGQHDGHRRAVVAFDLAREELLGADQVDLLLFFLNLLDWLAPADSGVRVVRTGDVEVIDGLPPLPRRIIDPRQRTTTVAADRVVTIDAALAGEYRVAANGTAVRVFANFADGEESDIGRAKPARVAAAAVPGRRTAATPPRGLAAWFYAISAALLLLEWFAARRNA